jgi:uncharacterized protein
MKRKTTERRILPLSIELRAGEGDQAGKLVGHAAVFDQWTRIAEFWGDVYEEKMAPGAFKKTISEGDIRALWNHDVNIVLGRLRAGTLELSEDETGLAATITPPDNEWGRPVMEAVKRGDVSGMSIAFQVVKDEWTTPDKKTEPDALRKRVIKEVRLFEVSPVTFPAYPQTDISARSEDTGDSSPLANAFRATRLAEMGQPLDADERAEIRAAIEYMRGVSGEPGAQADHSPEVPEPKPVDVDHSEAARARRLELLRKRQMEVAK